MNTRSRGGKRDEHSAKQAVRGGGRQPARPFPLLKPGQDPTSLEARVAYHLHRLKRTGKALRDCGYCRSYQTTDIAQGRVRLSPSDVVQLAEHLGVAETELSRSLTRDEAQAWTFYRASARDAEHVWMRARRAWESANLSVSAAARVMGLARSVVARNSRPGNKRGYKVLPYCAAFKLARELGIERGPAFVLEDAEL